MHALAIFLVISVNMVTGEKPVLSIHGSGTTNPNKCFWHVMNKMESRAKLPLHMTYRGIGGANGQTEFNTTPPVTYFGSGDVPLNKELYDYLSATEVIFQMPVFLSAVSFFHSIPNTPTLNLTACTLAKIFNRDITDWSHRDIVSMNPALEVPTAGLPIRVARRSDGGSSTVGITEVSSNKLF
jgi:ABC-type phosphate transport system substrate-binding protein